MTIDLYYSVMSPPCRSVILTAKCVGVELNLKLMDTHAGDHMKPEFLKKNPQHTIPAIDDNGFVLAESRAIMGYLVDQYGKDDSLYPKDPKKRALVNQRLDFDLGTLYQRHADFYYSQIMGKTAPDPEKFKKLDDAFGVLEKFLETNKWVAGSNMTIADIALATTASTSFVFGLSLDKFPKVCKWLENCKKAIPSYDELSREGLEKLKNFLDNVTKK